METSGDSQASGARLLAWIAVEEDGANVRFVGMVDAAATLDVRYTLRIMQLSGGNRSATSQGGSATLDAASGPVALSSVTLNVGAESAYAVTLVVRGAGGQEVRAEISNPPSEGL